MGEQRATFALVVAQRTSFWGESQVALAVVPGVLACCLLPCALQIVALLARSHNVFAVVALLWFIFCLHRMALSQTLVFLFLQASDILFSI